MGVVADIYNMYIFVIDKNSWFPREQDTGTSFTR